SYQIKITNPDGTTQVVPVESDRINIGSGPGSQIKLEGPGVMPNHGRALFTGKDGALFIDLSHQKAPVKWEIGTAVRIAEYTLELMTLEASAPQEPSTETLAEGVDVDAMPREEMPKQKTLPSDSEIIQRANELIETMTERSRRAGQQPRETTERQSKAQAMDNGTDSETDATIGWDVVEPINEESNTLSDSPPEPEMDEAIVPEMRTEADVPTAVGGDEQVWEDTTYKVRFPSGKPEAEDEAVTIDQKRRTDEMEVVPPLPLPEDEDLMDSEEVFVPLPRRSADIPPVPPVKFDDSDDETVATPPSLPEIPRRPAEPVELSEDTLPYLAEDEALDTQRYSGIPSPAPAPSSVVPQYTQPKDWVYYSNLSAQLTLNPVNVAGGERVRVPLSVRNGNQFSVEVRVAVTGLPSDWQIWLETSLRLFPGEIRPVDVVIQTRPAPQPVTINAVVHINDLQTPDTALQLPLAVVLKREIDLAGRLEPEPMDADQGGALCLYNHTLARVETFVSGKSMSKTVDLMLPQTMFQVPSGQEVRVPLRFEVRHRPLLFSTMHTFSITARQGSRAPLDYTGRVQVRPQVSWLALLLLLILIAVVVFIVLRAAAII
ncbi:MAG: hypothetical protein K8L99_13830, partial [Anaerolineae bacterium]|nr:hypothetical protein [Anaerolineae bacterium]